MVKYNSIMLNDVWEVMPRTVNKEVVGSRWIYKIKYVVDGSVEKYRVHGKRFFSKRGQKLLGDIFFNG